MESDLVEEFQLDILKQKNYCKLDLSDYKIVITPPIWGSMLTGKIDNEIIERFIEREKVVGKSKEKIWAKVSAKILPQKVKEWADSHYLIPRPFAESYNYVVEKGNKTIFDFYEDSWHNSIPSIGRNVSPMEMKKLMRGAVEGKVEPYRKHAIDVYQRDKISLLDALKNENFNLMFWYTDFLDKMGHAFISKKLILMKYYFEINSLVLKVKKLCPKSIIYIISDHGMESMKEGWGQHSNHGFFSSNTGELIKKPQDLFYLVSSKQNNKIDL